jgi:hypothetical protein
MLIQLVSFKTSLRADYRLRYTANIINASTADLILFAGYTLSYDIDALMLAELIENKKTTAILEVKNDNSSQLNPIHKSLFILQNGILKSMYSYQIFAESAQIDGMPYIADHLITELETRRRLKVANHKAIVFQCGENGILKNIQSQGNSAVFRFQDDTELSNRFDKVISNADIILNPIHSPMGNQGKMSKRREYFSANNRAYFSTANFDDVDSIENKSFQYAVLNGADLEPIDKEISKRKTYIIRTFEI